MLSSPILILCFLLLAGNIDKVIHHFLVSEEAYQLTSMTGRDQIWAVAMDEWKRNPIFGYGPNLFDLDYRISIGMLFATHAHNEFMDVLARSGVVGVISLVFYLIILLNLSIRCAAYSKGLSLALFMMLFFRAISEVPLNLFEYGYEFSIQLLLYSLMSSHAQSTYRCKIDAKYVII
jgi:O-antigen ligase